MGGETSRQPAALETSQQTQEDGQSRAGILNRNTTTTAPRGLQLHVTRQEARKNSWDERVQMWNTLYTSRRPPDNSVSKKRDDVGRESLVEERRPSIRPDSRIPTCLQSYFLNACSLSKSSKSRVCDQLITARRFELLMPCLDSCPSSRDFEPGYR